jgi:thiol-disulfide isomerase/thioredoxin
MQPTEGRPAHSVAPMSPLLALTTLAVLVVVATAVGLLQRRSSGRVRAAAADRVRPEELGVEQLGTEATLLQLSTELCAPCRSTARLLSGVAGQRAGVLHVEIDLTERPGLAQRFGVLQTPTTLLLDAAGVVRGRIGGVPRPAALGLELDDVIGGARV